MHSEFEESTGRSVVKLQINLHKLGKAGLSARFVLVGLQVLPFRQG